MRAYYRSATAYCSQFDETKLFSSVEEAREFDRRWAAALVAEQDDATLGRALREGDAKLEAAMRFLVDEFPAAVAEAPGSLRSFR